MDAATEFTLKQGFADIKKWMIGGESKRGWTTWTTAAVDKRVFAAMPIVMDMLDFNTVSYKCLKIYRKKLTKYLLFVYYLESSQTFYVIR